MKYKDTSNIFNKILKYRYLIGLIIFIVLLLFKINGSSIGMWEQIITSKVDKSQHSDILGKARDIRSDEWNVQTPYYLAQATGSEYYPVENYNVTQSGENMIVSYNAPVKDVSAISKPLNWGFLLLGKDYGLSWYWCMKLILLILLSFEICMIITRGNKLISVVGSLWITFTPAVQWWFMQHVGDLVLYLEAIVVSFYYFLKNFHSIKKKIIFSSLFSISSIGFVLVLYPALEVPMAYLCLIFMILIFTDFKDKIKIKSIDVILIVANIVFIALILLHVVLISKNALGVLFNTAYPGKRVSNGGDVPFYYVNLFLTNVFLPYKNATFLNNCEISSVFNFLPAVILALPVIFKEKIKDLKYGIVLIITSLFGIYYMLFKINGTVAKMTLLSYVTGNRMMIVYGLVGAYASIWAISIMAKLRKTKCVYAILGSMLITITYYYSIENSPIHQYVKFKYYLVLLVLLFVINFALLTGREILFSIFVLILVFIAGVTVNPIIRGTGDIYNNYLSYKIQDIKKSDPDAMWMNANESTGFIGAFLYANGVKTVGGTDFYPDLNKWKKLDENGEYKTIYNRYAHVNFDIYNGKTKFEMVALDSILVDINTNDLRKLNIKYILAKEDLSKFNSNNGAHFKDVYQRDKDGFYIFEVNYNNTK